MRNSNSARDIVSLWTLEQVAQRLNVGKRIIYALNKDEKLPAPFTVGRRKRWEPNDIELWLQWGSPNRQKFNRLKKERSDHGKRKKGDSNI